MFKRINESFDKKFLSLSEDVLNEDPTTFTLSADDLNDPKEVDFKKIIKRNADAEAKAKAEKERQEKIAAAKEKYKDVLNVIEGMNTDDAIEKLHQALVPGQGKAETVAGELVRATMRILYRDYNDGDKFFMGYGLETCGGSAQYLMDMGVEETLKEILSDTYRYADNDDAYTSALSVLVREVIKHILDNPELLAEPNDTDSRSYNYSELEETQPTLDYDFMLPYDVTKYLESGYVRERDVIDILESNLDGNGIRYGAVEFSGGDCIYIYDLTYEAYDEVDRWRMWQDRYWEYEVSEWESAYGDPDEEDYDEDDDIDESYKDTNGIMGEIGVTYSDKDLEDYWNKESKNDPVLGHYNSFDDWKNDTISQMSRVNESKRTNESPEYDMIPQYDSRQSFYGKARVDYRGNEKTLYSYNTPVARITGDKVELLPKWDWSQTTLRHVKEFLKQNGFEANSLAQMRKDYL